MKLITTGDRTYPKVFFNKEDAQVYIDWEIEKQTDWNDSMKMHGESVSNWIPAYYIEESVID